MWEPAEMLDWMSLDDSDENYPMDIFDHIHKDCLPDKEKVLSEEDVSVLMDTEILKVCSVTQWSRTKARSLLSYFKWDTEKLLEYYYAEDPGTLELIRGHWEFVICDREKGSTCVICLEAIKIRDLMIFSCNHRVCSACFAEYIRNVIASEGGLVRASINCPGTDCDLEIDEELVYAYLFLQDPALVFKYQKIIINNFVQNHRNLKWCPSAGCNNAVLLGAGETSNLLSSVRCDCGHWFCFYCQESSHDPVVCAMLKEWAEIKADDFTSENLSKKWIAVNTKQCPNCRFNIQKNGGCMHMTCRMCHHQFCWECMGDHHETTCGEAQMPPRQAPTQIAPRQNNENLRQMAVHKYITMKQSYELDLQQYKSKIQTEHPWTKWDFITNAIEILLQCRRTLTHSFIFSHFMTTIDNQIFIFDENLSSLEQRTEFLSQILEHELTTDTVSTLMDRIVTNTDLCKIYHAKLTNHIKEGYEKNWWRRFPIPPEELTGGVAAFESMFESPLVDEYQRFMDP